MLDNFVATNVNFFTQFEGMYIGQIGTMLVPAYSVHISLAQDWKQLYQKISIHQMA